MKITQEILKERYRYNRYTGIFTKRKNRRPLGWKDGSGYLCFNIFGRPYKVSRLAWLYMEGYFPENDIDHKDRIRDNNRWRNLRHVSRQCNIRNMGIRLNNTSGITGVSWRKTNRKWIAYITVSYKKIILGIYDDKVDAAMARWNGEKKYGFPNCCTESSAYKYLKEINLI